MKTLAERVSEYLKELRGRRGTKGLARVEGFFDNLLGAAPAKVDDARQRQGTAGPLWIPGLRAQPWFEAAEFPWLAEVAAARGELLAEGGALLEKGLLVRSQEGRTDLDYKDWVAFDLMTFDFDLGPGRFGCEVLTFPENRARAPKAVAQLERHPFIGDCFYSALLPGGVVSPHYSSFNGKLICHLGLSVPGDCGIRVAGEERRWEDGKFLIFDDTYLHDTWNRSRRPRLLFHTGLWHPDLTPLEIEALTGWFARSSRDGQPR
ncbi:MAG: aspartyl/asparaginyl beta-hydroxylase domain-containing protein [Elusimicrobiota bacterium]|nr:aspartyl/asparaginyl beta-hydroxylase domain-containing protein [Elusimicrobiota bacterium]